MIAVYCRIDSSPYTMYTLEIEEIKDFKSQLALYRFPEPEADVIFIENNRVIDQRLYSDL